MSQNLFWNLLAKKLSGEITTEELAGLEKLMKENPEWIYAAEHIENLWNLKLKEEADYDSELAFELHLNSLKKNGIDFSNLETPVSPTEFTSNDTNLKKRKRVFLFAAAAIFLLVSSSYFLWFANSKSIKIIPEKSFSEVSTKPGSKTKLLLPDSSVVWLNAGSTLTYNEHFGVTNRNTTLSGEAYFDVRKSTVPFIIHAHSIQIKVMGTAFNVKSYPNEKTTETSLIRGRVEITLDKRPGEKYILKPNEKLIVSNEAEETKFQPTEAKEPIVVLDRLKHANDSTIVETSWLNNKLIFQNESFEDLAKRMERWYGVTIEFNDEKSKTQRLSGTFTTETVQQALEELQITTRFHFILKKDIITITQ